MKTKKELQLQLEKLKSILVSLYDENFNLKLTTGIFTSYRDYAQEIIDTCEEQK